MEIATSISRISQSFNLYIVHFNQNDIKVHLSTIAFLQQFPFLYTKNGTAIPLGAGGAAASQYRFHYSLFIIYHSVTL